MNVAMVITGLSTGGAELMLLRLLEGIDRDRFAARVYSLTNLGEVGPRIFALGIPVESIDMKGRPTDVLAIIELARRLREAQTDLVHTWMYHADLVGGLAARCAGVRAVAWNIRNSNLAPGARLATRLVVRTNAFLSRWVPSGIVSCSEAARGVHVAIGYAPDKFTVIPNGFDLSRFRPDARARDSVRAELGLPNSAQLVGLVGRFDPQKNHVGFLQAAGILGRLRPDVHFVLAGTGLDQQNAELVSAARSHGVSDVVHWLGLRDDIPRLMASLDVLASASLGEAFPNVIGEAMACGVPCAVTDVGDSAAIVGDTGKVSTPGDMPALAAAIGELLALNEGDRASLAGRARARVQERFEIGNVIRRYEDYYRALACAAT